MRQAWLGTAGSLAAALAVASQAGTQTSTESLAQLAFVEIDAEHRSCYLHEPIELELRVGFDQEFFEQGALQLFQQALDVELQLLAPWLQGSAELQRQSDQEPQGEGPRLVVNDEVVHARRLQGREVAGRRFGVLAISQRFLPLRAGELVLAAPKLRFAYATQFTEDFLRGRVPVDRQVAESEGPRLSLTIHPLPEAGRPPGFGGAVGRFELSVRAEPAELRVGESLKLALELTGRGNFEWLEAPLLDSLEGWHALGVVAERGATGAVFTYDLSPASAASSVLPPIAFSYFDPTPPASYKTIASAPIELLVHAPPETEDVTASAERHADPQDEQAAAFVLSSPLYWRGVVSGALAGAFLCLGLTYLLTRRRGQASAPATLERRVQSEPATKREQGLAQELSAYLAHELGCPRAALIGAGLVTRLVERGVPPELADRAQRTLAELIGPSYGGRASTPAVGDLIAALDAAFRARR